MSKTIALNKKKSLMLVPKAPYNFDGNFHKPSHFPSSDNDWKKGIYWTTMLWQGKILGLKVENKGKIDNPKIKVNIYSKRELNKNFISSLKPELKWRFNIHQDISKFDFDSHDIFKKWKGTKSLAINSLYETLIIFFVLQNATVKRSVQMLENLFKRFGKKVKFDDKILSTFWTPQEMFNSNEEELRKLKVGYRAKFFMKLTEQFVRGKIDEFKLRKMDKEEVKKKALEIFGIGPASVEYLLFGHFYFLDALEMIPPWEQKIFSRLLFNKEKVSTDKILSFFKKYRGFEKLASHYIWEDLFWKRKHEHIEWLEKEIRL